MRLAIPVKIAIRPGQVLSTPGRGLATCALQEAHMTAFYPSRPHRLRHPIPPYPGARPLPGAPS